MANMPARVVVRWVFLLAATAGLASEARGQEVQTAFEFPSAPANWINFSPLTAKSLAGKGVVLYFFEEGCPRCRDRWPELLQTAQRFAGQPVICMAVNSGNPRGVVEAYVRQQRITWPVIVDTNRQFERICNVPEISLQNIYQVAILRPDGSLARGNAANLEESIRMALDGASWRVDPQTVSPDMRSAWLQIELGNFSAASTAVKKGLVSGNPETKAAAEKLQAAVQAVIEEQTAQASEHLAQSKKWQAYKIYNHLSDQFDGYTLPEVVTEQQKALANDPAIAEELKAMKSLAAAQKIGARGSVAAVRRAATMLRRLAEEMPQTEAAQQATAILQQIEPPQAIGPGF